MYMSGDFFDAALFSGFFSRHARARRYLIEDIFILTLSSSYSSNLGL